MIVSLKNSPFGILTSVAIGGHEHGRARRDLRDTPLVRADPHQVAGLERRVQAEHHPGQVVGHPVLEDEAGGEAHDPDGADHRTHRAHDAEDIEGEQDPDEDREPAERDAQEIAGERAHAEEPKWTAPSAKRAREEQER